MKKTFYFCAILLFCLLTGKVVAQAELSQEQKLQKDVEQARNQGDMARADQLAKELLLLTDESDSIEWRAEALYEQARNAMERNNYEQSTTLLNQSIALFQDTAQRKRLADAYRQLGLTYRYQSNYPTALEYIYLAMQIYQEVDDKSAISSTYNSIGLVMEKMGQLEEASKAHNQALKLHYELNNEQGIASALYNIGDIYRSMGDYEKALPYLQDALKMDLAAGDPKYIAYSYNKIGFMLIQSGDLVQSRDYLYKALELFKQIEAPRDTDWALTSIAELELVSGNIDLAHELINGVIKRAVANNYNSLLVDAYHVAARIALQQNELEPALKLIDKGIEQAVANDEVGQQVQFEELRVKILIAKDAIQEAFDALKRQQALDAQILNSRRVDTIARMQAQSDFVAQAQRIKLLENEKMLQQATLEREQLSLRLWLISISASCVVLLLGYSRFNQRRLNRLLAEQVKQRTQQLEDKNSELIQAYEDMESISMTDKLTGIKNRRYLERFIEDDIARSIRLYQDWNTDKASKPVQADIIFFLIDLDNFKDVNDQYGHVVGDKVLQECVVRMQKVFRQSDYLVRWGGEEFVAVARFTDRDSAPLVAQRMVEEIKNSPFSIGPDIDLNLTCSIGYCCFASSHDDHAPTWQSTLAIADACAYVIKFSGKDGWLGVESLSQDLDLSTDVSTTNLHSWNNSGDIVIHSSLQPADLKWKAS